MVSGSTISRRDFVRMAGVASAGLALGGGVATEGRAAPSVRKPPARGRPNVLVFFTDQQRWDTTGVHGNPMGLTPNFDRMARAGTHLFHAFTPQPVCGPARSCMQTGRYATRTGCFRNGVPLPPGQKTLAHHFNAAGYETAYIGKWHLAAPAHAGPVPPEERGGYEYWLAANVLESVSHPYDAVLFDSDEKRVDLPGYRVDALTDAAIRYLDGRTGDRPFFLFLSFLEPHHQNDVDDFPPPTGYREMYTAGWTPPDLAALGGSTQQHLGGYYGMVKRLDEALGRTLDALKSLGLEENTIVLFASDHGNHFKTRNWEYKRSGHEASIRVPVALSGPGFDGGGQVRRLASLLDIPPTLLDAAGIPVPDEMQGHSLMPLVRREPMDRPDDVFVQVSESEVGRVLRTRRWKYGVVAKDANAWKDPGADHYTEQYLYDLDHDPYELDNLAGYESHRVLSDALMKRLIARMVEAGEKPPAIAPAPPRPGGQRKVAADEMPWPG